MAFDEDTVLTGSQDGLIRIISILPNSMLGVVGEHGDFPVETLALSHDRCAQAMPFCGFFSSLPCTYLSTLWYRSSQQVGQVVSGRPSGLLSCPVEAQMGPNAYCNAAAQCLTAARPL